MQTPAAADASPDGYRITISPVGHRVRVVYDGVVLADSERAFVLRETRLEPVVYFPKADVRMDLLEPTTFRTHCPFKGDATYYSVNIGGTTIEDAAWSYEDPFAAMETIRGHIAFASPRLLETAGE